MGTALFPVVQASASGSTPTTPVVAHSTYIAQLRLLDAEGIALSWAWHDGTYNFSGLTPQQLQELLDQALPDVDVTVVGATTVSTAGDVVSLATSADGTWMILAGANGPNAVCWSIVVSASSTVRLDGHTGAGTWYLRLGKPGNHACDAVRFDEESVVKGSSSTRAPWGMVGAWVDLQTAFTGVKTYFTQNNQSYLGLNPQTFKSVDTGLTGVGGKMASTSDTVVSIHVALDGSAVMLAIAPRRGATCWGIVDATSQTGELDGYPTPGALYLEVPNPGKRGCAAIIFNRKTQIPGSYADTTGFLNLPLP